MSLFLAGILVFFAFFTNESKVISRITKHNRKQISDINPNDIVRIKGKVVYAGSTLISPLTKRKCSLYSVRIKDNSGISEFFRNYIYINEIKAADIVLYDGVNYAYIDCKYLNAHIIEDSFQRSDTFNMTSPELMAFLKKHNYPMTDAIGWNLDLDAFEGILEEGEIVNVAGKCSWVRSSKLNLNIPDQDILYITPEENKAVYITDDRQI